MIDRDAVGQRCARVSSSVSPSMPGIRTSSRTQLQLRGSKPARKSAAEP